MAASPQFKHQLPIRKREKKLVVDFRKLPDEFYPKGCRSGQKGYPTRKESNQVAQAAWDDWMASYHQSFNFSVHHRQAAIAAFSLLAAAGVGDPCEALKTAVKEYIRNAPGQHKSRSIADVVAEFIESHARSGNAPTTVASYAWTLNRLARSMGDKLIHEVSSAELEKWMNDKGLRGYNRRNHLNYLNILWRFAIDRHYARSNPTKSITRVRRPPIKPGIFDADEIRKLLAAALDYENGAILPFFAIGCFCGVRPYELRRIDWQDINMETEEIYVSSDASKTHQDRFVDMPDCLMAWLRLVPEEHRKGRVFWTRPGFDAVRKKAGLLNKWKQHKDIMRHSAASHLYKKTRDINITTEQMGHGIGTFEKYYRRAVSNAAAIAYFEVFPGSQNADHSEKGGAIEET